MVAARYKSLPDYALSTGMLFIVKIISGINEMSERLCATHLFFYKNISLVSLNVFLNFYVIE